MTARRFLSGVLLVSATLGGCGRSDEPPAPVPPQQVSAAPQPKLPPPWPPLDKAVALAERPLAVNYYVVLDASGSMLADTCADGESKIAVAKRAVAEFAHSLPADTQFGLLAFDEHGVRERIPLGPMRSRDLGPVLDGVHAGAGTPLKSAITKAYAALTKQGQRQLGYGEYHLVVVTDGEYTPLAEDPQHIVAEVLDGSPVVIHTVGFCIDDRHSLNQPGRTLYSAASSPEELMRGLHAVLAEAPSFDVSSFKP